MTDTTTPEHRSAQNTRRPRDHDAGSALSADNLPTFEDLRAATAASGPTDAQLAAHFAPVFAAVAAGSAQREQDHELAFAAIEYLRGAGFTRVRLGREYGGIGASLPQLADLLVDLAAADSNLPQALHG